MARSGRRKRRDVAGQEQQEEPTMRTIVLDETGPRDLGDLDVGEVHQVVAEAVGEPTPRQVVEAYAQLQQLAPEPSDPDHSNPEYWIHQETMAKLASAVPDEATSPAGWRAPDEMEVAAAEPIDWGAEPLDPSTVLDVDPFLTEAEAEAAYGAAFGDSVERAPVGVEVPEEDTLPGIPSREFTEADWERDFCGEEAVAAASVEDVEGTEDAWTDEQDEEAGGVKMTFTNDELPVGEEHHHGMRLLPVGEEHHHGMRLHPDFVALPNVSAAVEDPTAEISQTPNSPQEFEPEATVQAAPSPDPVAEVRAWMNAQPTPVPRMADEKLVQRIRIAAEWTGKCPKASGSDAAHNWGIYVDGMQVAAYLAHPEVRGGRRRARRDLAWDLARGFIYLQSPNEWALEQSAPLPGWSQVES